MTIADLRTRPAMRHAHVFLIEGVPFAFTDEHALSTEAGSWWTFDERVVLNGLVVPETLTTSLDVESGQFQDDTATFQLIDFDEETIPQFFGNLFKDFSQLGERITPLQDPTPAFVMDTAQGVFAPAGGYLGTEAIGPEGERHYYSATPWAPSAPGQDHPTFEEPNPVFTTGATGPYLVEGRRVTLLRIIWDEDTGLWPSAETQWAEALAGGWAPALWFGTLRQAGEVDGRVWSIDCAGPGSWLRKSLATRASTKWYPMTADFALAYDEKAIVISCNKHLFTDASNKVFGQSPAYVVDPADPFGSVQTAVYAVAGLAGADGVWTDTNSEGAGAIVFDEALVSVSVEAGYGFNATIYVTLHFKVWRYFGYDPLQDEGNLEGPGPKFKPSPYLPGYWTAVFSTTPAGLDPDASDLSLDWVGNVAPRIYTPGYPGGLSIITGAGGQVVRLSSEDAEQIYVEPQTIRPNVGGAVDEVDCTASRWWAFKGPLQLEGGEVEDTVQVARCSWVEDFPGFMALDDSGVTRGLYVHEWLDPRLFGLNHRPISEALGWAVRNEADAEADDLRVRASPLTVFGVFNRSPDVAADTILRILLSTGTAEWDPAALDGTDADLAELWATYLTDGANGKYDKEIADLGLALPDVMVDTDSVIEAADDLPAGAEGRLAVGKVAVHGAVQSEQLLEALMASRAWTWSLIRGRFGIYAQHIGAEEKFDGSTDATLTVDDLAGEAGDPSSAIPTVDLRPVFPFERLTSSYAGDPVEGWLDGQLELASKARDLGARARMGNREHSLACPDLVATEWLVGDPDAKVDGPLGTWQGEFQALWERTIPAWLARPHRLIQGLRISRTQGQDLGVGSLVRLSNPWPANSYGTYGLSGVAGRVVSVTHETASCVAVVDVLAEATPPDLQRWAPVLRVVDAGVTDSDDRWDVATQTWFFRTWGGVDAALPLAALIRPADLALEGTEEDDVRLVLLAFDGVTWERIATLTVASVNTTARSLTMAEADLDWEGSYSASYWPSRAYLVMVLDPAQDCWTRRRFARHTPVGGAGARKLAK